MGRTRNHRSEPATAVGLGEEAVVYVRVSSKDQEREGFSIPAQLDLLRMYANSKGFSNVGEFVDVETAKAVGRAGFSQMIAFLKKNPSCRTILASAITAKPAMRDHFKTGHMSRTQDLHLF